MVLSSKRRMFVEAYLATWNASEAARQAGYAHADRQGHRLLKIVEVQVVIQTRLKEKAMQADEVLARLADQGRVNIGDFIIEEQVTKYDDQGQPYQATELALDWNEIKNRGYLVKKISRTAHGPVIELHDGQAALAHIGRHLGLFKDINIDIDISKLSDTQLERIAEGEDIYKILAEGDDAPAKSKS